MKMIVALLEFLGIKRVYRFDASKALCYCLKYQLLTKEFFHLAKKSNYTVASEMK